MVDATALPRGSLTSRLGGPPLSALVVGFCIYAPPRRLLRGLDRPDVLVWPRSTRAGFAVEDVVVARGSLDRAVAERVPVELVVEAALGVNSGATEEGGVGDLGDGGDGGGGTDCGGRG